MKLPAICAIKRSRIDSPQPMSLFCDDDPNGHFLTAHEPGCPVSDRQSRVTAACFLPRQHTSRTSSPLGSLETRAAMGSSRVDARCHVIRSRKRSPGQRASPGREGFDVHVSPSRKTSPQRSSAEISQTDPIVSLFASAKDSSPFAPEKAHLIENALLRASFIDRSPIHPKKLTLPATHPSIAHSPMR